MEARLTRAGGAGEARGDGGGHRARGQESAGRHPRRRAGVRQPAGRRAADSQILKEIVGRIDALDQMMKDLLLFARPPQPRYAPTDVVPLVAATASLLSQDPAVREVDIVVEGSAPPLPADAGNAPDRLSQPADQRRPCDARQRTDSGGGGQPATRRARSPSPTADPGIPADVRDKIFTPFFTTKSRGSGLGLPTAKRLIEAHKGQLVIDARRRAARPSSYTCPPPGPDRSHAGVETGAAESRPILRMPAIGRGHARRPPASRARRSTDNARHRRSANPAERER